MDWIKGLTLFFAFYLVSKVEKKGHTSHWNAWLTLLATTTIATLTTCKIYYNTFWVVAYLIFFFLFFSNEQVTGTIMYFKTHMIIFKQLLYSNCKAIYMHFFESVKVSMAEFSNLTTRHDSTTSQTPIYNSVTYWFRVWSWWSHKLFLVSRLLHKFPCINFPTHDLHPVWIHI